ELAFRIRPCLNTSRIQKEPVRLRVGEDQDGDYGDMTCRYHTLDITRGERDPSLACLDLQRISQPRVLLGSDQVGNSDRIPDDTVSLILERESKEKLHHPSETLRLMLCVKLIEKGEAPKRIDRKTRHLAHVSPTSESHCAKTIPDRGRRPRRAERPFVPRSRTLRRESQ